MKHIESELAQELQPPGITPGDVTGALEVGKSRVVGVNGKLAICQQVLPFL